MREPVSLHDVCHSYGRNSGSGHGHSLSLDHVTVDFPAGSVTALTGPNGCGKSTLLGLLAGTLRPSDGRITGRPDNVCIVPQHSQTPELFRSRSVTPSPWDGGGCRKDAADCSGRSDH